MSPYVLSMSEYSDRIFISDSLVLVSMFDI